MEYINFNYASNHFKEILPQLKEICNDNISEFREFVISIYSFLSTIISNLDLKLKCIYRDYDEDGFCFNLECDKLKKIFSCYCNLLKKDLETISDKGCLTDDEI